MSVIGGETPTIHTYDHLNQTWSTDIIPELPMSLDSCVSAAVHQGRLYAMDRESSLVCQLSSSDKIGNGTIRKKWYQTKKDLTNQLTMALLNVVDDTNHFAAARSSGSSNDADFIIRHGIILVDKIGNVEGPATAGLKTYTPTTGDFTDLSLLIPTYRSKITGETTLRNGPPNQFSMYRRTVMLPTGIMIMFITCSDNSDQIWALNIKHVITATSTTTPSTEESSSTPWVWLQLPSLPKNPRLRSLQILGVIESID
jgi:hypothetical protein